MRFQPPARGRGMGWVRAIPLAELDEGRMRPVELAGEMLLLLRQGEGVRAFGALCPHKFTSLLDGTVADGRVRCPQHDASFDLATGAPWPGQPWAGWLPVYAARVADGFVEVDLSARPDAGSAGR
jgi:nitrite reductase/ring-hydroxylating ferredoxin subunit